VVNLRSNNFLVVTTWGSQDKSRVMEMINWLNHRDAYDLMNYGIRNTHWKPVGEDRYKILEESYRMNNPLLLLTSNPSYERVPSVFGEDLDFRRQLAAFTRRSDDFTFDILHGFEFDSRDVRGDIQTIEALYYGKYYFPVFNGLVDRKKIWDLFSENAEPYVKKIQNELQRQIDAFLVAECPSCLDPLKPADLP
jgi:putative aldouronate transport system substrate-binding protein